MAAGCGQSMEQPGRPVDRYTVLNGSRPSQQSPTPLLPTMGLRDSDLLTPAVEPLTQPPAPFPCSLDVGRAIVWRL